jgi:hypothetical protein
VGLLLAPLWRARRELCAQTPNKPLTFDAPQTACGLAAALVCQSMDDFRLDILSDNTLIGDLVIEAGDVTVELVGTARY